ncbi:hypothetical protein F444_07475 [Phytophthora nicotianae P1976]|uniref:Uncharacterized protein n=1 Tax=Phytophthora nicotianae P1976 TaxID=1317066 RepID=A0A081AEI4_PHYNI|nr:hypothetical protein F444_07475 [Phytophthora nicotianae P1976]
MQCQFGEAVGAKICNQEWVLCRFTTESSPQRHATGTPDDTYCLDHCSGPGYAWRCASCGPLTLSRIRLDAGTCCDAVAHIH